MLDPADDDLSLPFEEQIDILLSMYPDRNLTTVEDNAISQPGKITKARIDVSPNVGGDTRLEFLQCTVEYCCEIKPAPAAVQPPRNKGKSSSSSSSKNPSPSNTNSAKGQPQPSHWKVVKSVNMDEEDVKVLLHRLSTETDSFLDGVPLAVDLLTSMNEELRGDCPVCLLPLHDEEEMAASGGKGVNLLFRPSVCFHAMHRDCVSEYWSSVPNPVCPVCRAEAADADFLELGIKRFVEPEQPKEFSNNRDRNNRKNNNFDKDNPPPIKLANHMTEEEFHLLPDAALSKRARRRRNRLHERGYREWDPSCAMEDGGVYDETNGAANAASPPIVLKPAEGGIRDNDGSATMQKHPSTSTTTSSSATSSNKARTDNNLLRSPRISEQQTATGGGSTSSYTPASSSAAATSTSAGGVPPKKKEEVKQTALQLGTKKNKEFKESFQKLKEKNKKDIQDAQYYRTTSAKAAYAILHFTTAEKALKLMLELRNKPVQEQGTGGESTNDEDSWKVNYYFPE
ncbi:unnamed protein product [Amoebophrya sp. A120]|nr:unnamed protein product [Amoebophrya sp. A120]|eukprot:GSA120T00025591001.1